MADIETTVSAPTQMLADSALTLAAAIRGVYKDASGTIAGAVSDLDFTGQPVLRLTVTGDLSGSFTWPPVGLPALAADSQSVLLAVAFIQDDTGGHVIDLDTLFLNAGVGNISGVPLVDDTAGGITVVEIAVRRMSGTNTYEVYFAPTFDANQVTSGVFNANVLPVATPLAAGVTALAPGSGAAAAGNHTHPIAMSARFTIANSDNSALTTGDRDILDMPAGGTVTRLTRARLQGTGTPTATITVKIAGTAVTGTGTAATGVAYSSDANASAANVFVERQLLQVGMTITGGTVTLAEGIIHYTVNSSPWAG